LSHVSTSVSCFVVVVLKLLMQLEMKERLIKVAAQVIKLKQERLNEW
jgi:hypothetical protein